MVPSCGYIETALVNFAKAMLCFSKPRGPIIPSGPVLSALLLYVDSNILNMCDLEPDRYRTKLVNCHTMETAIFDLCK